MRQLVARAVGVVMQASEVPRDAQPRLLGEAVHELQQRFLFLQAPRFAQLRLGPRAGRGLDLAENARDGVRDPE